MIRVIIIDDHLLFREGLKQVLARSGDIAVVGEAGTVGDAMALLARESCDVILLDISLPGGSGFDILRRVMDTTTGSEPHSGRAVLVLSMHPEDQYATRMLRAGAKGYITKESAGEELITAIRKVARGGRYISASLAEHLATAVLTPGDLPPHHTLSDREFEVFRHIVLGTALKDIADQLSLSEKTITTYRARILEKLGVRNNVELARYAIEHGID